MEFKFEYDEVIDGITKLLVWEEREQWFINIALANLDCSFKDERKRKEARRLLEEGKEQNAFMIEAPFDRKKE